MRPNLVSNRTKRGLTIVRVVYTNADTSGSELQSQQRVLGNILLLSVDCGEFLCVVNIMGDKTESVRTSEVKIELSGEKRDKIMRSNSDESDPEFKQSCALCQSRAVAFTNYPCQCCAFCKKCAMKIATGGKCRVCSSIFSSMRGMDVNDS
jgi:hypothetical protein